jgi:hypothetical protein
MLHLPADELCGISVLLEDERNIQYGEERKHTRFSVHEMLNNGKTEGDIGLYT